MITTIAVQFMQKLGIRCLDHWRFGKHRQADQFIGLGRAGAPGHCHVGRTTIDAKRQKEN